MLYVLRIKKKDGLLAKVVAYVHIYGRRLHPDSVLKVETLENNQIQGTPHRYTPDTHLSGSLILLQPSHFSLDQHHRDLKMAIELESDSDLALKETLHQIHLGRAKIDLDHLEFGDPNRCQRFNLDFWILAAVMLEFFWQILQFNGLQSLPGDIIPLRLPPGVRIPCLRGRRTGDKAAVGKWISMWRPGNQRDFWQLDGLCPPGQSSGPRIARSIDPQLNRLLRVALDALIPFPGLWSTWVNLHQLLPLRAPEILAVYLTLIRVICYHMTGGRPEILDARTMEALQGRSPQRSWADRAHITDVFEDGTAYAAVTCPQEREVLRLKVMQIPHIIPSLYTFHQDVKYLEPVLKLMRQLMLRSWKGTIKKGLQRCYSSPRDNGVRIQTSENSYHLAAGMPVEYGFWSAYRQVFLAGMCDFFGLVPNFQPIGMHKVPPRTRQPDSQVLWGRFSELARSVGFLVPRLQGGVPAPVALDARPIARPLLTTDEDLGEWSVRSCCGMTDGNSFFSDQKYLYLDNIYSPPPDEPAEWLTSFAVKRDIFLAFFPPFTEAGCLSASSPQPAEWNVETRDQMNPLQPPNPPIPPAHTVTQSQTEPILDFSDQLLVENPAHINTNMDQPSISVPPVEINMDRPRSLELAADTNPPPVDTNIDQPSISAPPVKINMNRPHSLELAADANPPPVDTDMDQLFTSALHDNANVSGTVSQGVVARQPLEIVKQDHLCCWVRVNVEPQQYVNTFFCQERSGPQYKCIFVISDSDALCVLSQNAERYLDYVSLEKYK
ncbi:uncharacterized protein BDCG_17576 [Blastomyces dermatitidis ER-3]|uniref:Uncharacterized protein n=1 Tax=Ajellomyces dermatitidis (strain ER-3 / ATCC MYA-2586) TaxID=559297 RepID=A0ABX2VZ98_AJEDR|nr:uncharacterized protein BDCG_17576 [Blastomyces dermatitidis ER-3]OAT02469.1 hypothetical protein BDCG_17576 [Blastomyces dermatitidis ER-3]